MIILLTNKGKRTKVRQLKEKKKGANKCKIIKKTNKEEQTNVRWLRKRTKRVKLMWAENVRANKVLAIKLVHLPKDLILSVLEPKNIGVTIQFIYKERQYPGSLYLFNQASRF